MYHFCNDKLHWGKSSSAEIWLSVVHCQARCFVFQYTAGTVKTDFSRKRGFLLENTNSAKLQFVQKHAISSEDCPKKYFPHPSIIFRKERGNTCSVTFSNWHSLGCREKFTPLVCLVSVRDLNIGLLGDAQLQSPLAPSLPLFVILEWIQLSPYS